MPADTAVAPGAFVDERAMAVVVDGTTLPFSVSARSGGGVLELDGRSVRVRPLLWREKLSLARFAHLPLKALGNALIEAATDDQAGADLPDQHRRALLALAMWMDQSTELPLDTKALVATALMVCRSTDWPLTALDDRPASEVAAIADVVLDERAADVDAARADASRSGDSGDGFTRIEILPDSPKTTVGEDANVTRVAPTRAAAPRSGVQARAASRDAEIETDEAPRASARRQGVAVPPRDRDVEDPCDAPTPDASRRQREPPPRIAVTRPAPNRIAPALDSAPTPVGDGEALVRHIQPQAAEAGESGVRTATAAVHDASRPSRSPALVSPRSASASKRARPRFQGVRYLPPGEPRQPAAKAPGRVRVTDVGRSTAGESKGSRPAGSTTVEAPMVFGGAAPRDVPPTSTSAPAVEEISSAGAGRQAAAVTRDPTPATADTESMLAALDERLEEAARELGILVEG